MTKIGVIEMIDNHL